MKAFSEFDLVLKQKQCNLGVGCCRLASSITIDLELLRCKDLLQDEERMKEQSRQAYLHLTSNVKIFVTDYP